MTGRIYTEITSRGPNPLETTITYETTATCSTIGDSFSSVIDVFNYQVVRSWSSWCVIRASTPLDSSPRKRKRRCTEGAEEDIQPQEKLKRIPIYDSLTPTAQEGVISSKNHGIHLEMQKLKIRDEATRELEKMLSGTENCTAIALEIVAQLSHKGKVLLSCTTMVVGKNFANLAECQKPENWAEEEREDFYLKFSAFEGERWCREDILCLWVKLSKVLSDKIEAWQQPEACCTKVWKADCDFGDYRHILKDLAHRNEHRLGEARKLGWKSGLDVSSSRI